MCVSMRKHNYVNREIQMRDVYSIVYTEPISCNSASFTSTTHFPPQTLFGASRTSLPLLNLISLSPLVHDGLIQIFRNAETKV